MSDVDANTNDLAAGSQQLTTPAMDLESCLESYAQVYKGLTRAQHVAVCLSAEGSAFRTLPESAARMLWVSL